MRPILSAIGVGMLVLGVGLFWFAHAPGSIVLAIAGLLLTVGTVFERRVYKRVLRKQPGPGWQRTAERFVDEDSGAPVTVYVDPATGERAYVRD